MYNLQYCSKQWTGLLRHFNQSLIVVGVICIVALILLAGKASGQISNIRPPVPGAPKGMIAFIDVNIVPMDTERVLLHQTVLVKDGWIIALGPNQRVQVPKGAMRIAGRGKYLIPGLADMHAHVAGLTMASLAIADTTLLEYTLFHELAKGLTTVRNMGWDNTGKLVLRYRTRAAAGQLWSPRIYTSGQWVDLNRIAAAMKTPLKSGAQLDTIVAQLASTLIQEYKIAGYDHLKVYAPSLMVFDSLVAAARRVGMPVVGHVPERLPLHPDSVFISYDMHLMHSIEARMKSIEHIDQYLLSNHPSLDTSNTHALAGATKQANIWVTPTIAVLVGLGFPARYPEKWALARPMLTAFQTAGVGILLGIDNPLMAPSDELQALVKYGLTPYQALLTGTRNVAQYFDTQDSTGTVAVGKRADLVLLTGNPLADIGSTAHPAGVMIGGRWLSRAAIDEGLKHWQQRIEGPQTPPKAIRSPARPPVPTAVPNAPAGVTAFVDVNIIPMDTERMLPHQTVLVQGGRISAFGSVKKVKVPAGAVRIDARGRYLIPGLADMHAHLTTAARLTYGFHDSLQAAHRLFQLFLANGVTTIRNLDYSSARRGAWALHFKAQATAGTLWSPRIYTAGAWYGTEDLLPPNGLTPAQVSELIARYKKNGYDIIKFHNFESSSVFAALVAAARHHGMPLIGHSPMGGISEAIAAGFKSVEHLGGYQGMIIKDATGHERVDTARIRALVAETKQAGLWVCPTLALFTPPSPAVSLLIRMLFEANAGLLLGADDGTTFDNDVEKWRFPIQDELRTLVTAGLTPYQALVTGTRNPAIYFGSLDETGTIAVGKRADLVLLRGNPLEDINNTQQPTGVMIGGRWLPRTEIERRTAEQRAVVQREAHYRHYADSMNKEIARILKEVKDMMMLTTTQQDSLSRRRSRFNLMRTEFLDSLGWSQDTMEVYTRIRQRAESYFGAIRTVLLPAQQSLFDAKIQNWRKTGK